jgi:hypothetical protein
MTVRLARGCAAALALFVAGCGALGGNQPPGPCPRAVIVQDASRQVKFQGKGRDLTDVLYETQVQGAQLACDYDEGAIDSVLKVRFFAARGPADRERQAQIRYFVAVAREPGLQVVAREEFALAVPFEGNRTQVAVTEELEPRIPISGEETGADYRIFIGLSLTPEELEYNRSSR